jgi:hypothetical protein
VKTARILLAGIGVLGTLVGQNSVTDRHINPAAPPVSAADWRRNLTRTLSQTAANTDTRDLERVERYLLGAGSYCTALTPGDYASNRELVRSLAGYFGAVNYMALDPQSRAIALRASRAFARFPCAFPGRQPQAQATGVAPPPSPGTPPFSLQAPALENVSDGDRDNATDLQTRYETDAARAVSAWTSAQLMRETLAERGMSLNAQTAASVDRLPLFFAKAEDGLRERDWAEARGNLEAIEAETQKIAKAVGR